MNIIMFDDSPEDSLLMENAIAESESSKNFYVIHEFKSAKEFIEKTSIHEPSVFFIDLSFPDGDGFELLKSINKKHKNNPYLIPIILSTSKNNKDVYKSRECGAFSYIVKPDDFKDWVKLVNKSYNYWQDLNRFPSECL